jgi:hypothetical protein
MNHPLMIIRVGSSSIHTSQEIPRGAQGQSDSEDGLKTILDDPARLMENSGEIGDHRRQPWAGSNLHLLLSGLCRSVQERS